MNTNETQRSPRKVRIVVGGLIAAATLSFGLGIVGPTPDASAAVVCNGIPFGSGQDVDCWAYSGNCWQFAEDLPDGWQCFDPFLAPDDGPTIDGGTNGPVLQSDDGTKLNPRR